MSAAWRATVLALAAFGMTAAASATLVHFNYAGRWTGLFCIGSGFPRPHELDKNIWVFRNSYGYDGQFYRILAHDPSLGRKWRAYYDVPGMRTRRILVPALAYLGALGAQDRIDAAYILVVWMAIACGVWWLARLAESAGRSAAWGLSYLALPSTLVSIDRMVVDGMLTSLAIGIVFFLRRERWRAVWLLLALACLTRETGLLLVLGVCTLEVYERRRKRAAVLATAAVPWMGWLAYDAWRVHDPVFYPGEFSYPGRALVGAMSDAGNAIGLLDVLALVSFFATFLLVIRLARQRKDLFALAAPYIPLALLLLSRRGDTDFTEIYAYGRQFGPMLAMILIGATELAKPAWWLPLAVLSFRGALPLASQLFRAARDLMHG